MAPCNAYKFTSNGILELSGGVRIPGEEAAGVILDTVGPGGEEGGGEAVRDGVEGGEAHHTLRGQR